MKKALVVIDMQNDYLWEKRKKKFTYNTEALAANVNGIIRQFQSEGSDVIYIKHFIQNLWTNRALFGFSIEGTEGAELYGGLDVVSENVFGKYFPDAFSNADFKAFVKNGGYDTLSITGIDLCGCVGATARGALKNGLRAELIESAIGTKFPPEKADKVRAELIIDGAEFV